MSKRHENEMWRRAGENTVMEYLQKSSDKASPLPKDSPERSPWLILSKLPIRFNAESLTDEQYREALGLGVMIMIAQGKIKP